VRVFKGADGGEETLITGPAANWMTPSMQRFVHYYDRARQESRAVANSRSAATWSLLAVRLVGVVSRPPRGDDTPLPASSAANRRELEKQASSCVVEAPWCCVHRCAALSY